MVACYACHRLTPYVLPHGAMLPVYCPGCLHELADQILHDLAEARLLQLRVRKIGDRLAGVYVDPPPAAELLEERM